VVTVPSHVEVPYELKVHFPVTVPVEPVSRRVLPAWSWCRYSTAPELLLICSTLIAVGP
jgi:hypothetical protein